MPDDNVFQPLRTQRMTPAARVQAAIELLDAIATAAREGGAAADTLVARYFKTRRYAGSKDRRAVRDLVYAAIRLVADVPETGRAAMLTLVAEQPELAAAFDGSPHGPAPITSGEGAADRGIAPDWLTQAFAAAGLDAEEQAALVGRAPLDVRVNSLQTSRDEVAAEIEGAAPITGLADGLRLPAGYDVTALGGRVEVQDAGSQIVTRAVRATPGQRIVDLCAGGGGKTLALAAAMANEGAILAADVDRARLSRLAPRTAAAGVTIAETLLLDPGREAAALAEWAGKADAVLVDAPCSGTGTWRRNPEARWRLTPARLERLGATQRHVLDTGAALVRPGGALIYVVCSLLDAEGPAIVGAFLADHGDWTTEPLDLPAGRRHGPGARLTPAHDGTDGFFVARLVAPC